MAKKAAKLVVAAAQATPVFLDRKRTVEKACDLIADAARRGARLVVFPEAFVPAYPDWVWVVPPGDKPTLDGLYAELLDNAVTVPDAATAALCRAAKKARIHVAIGVSERNAAASGASLYNSLLLIADDGAILGVHRKLVPTGGERLVWAPGDGASLRAFDTTLGTVGGLICWENYMPLARFALYSAGVRIYLAPTWDYGDVWQATVRHIAKEGGTFVISCCMPLRVADIPKRYRFRSLYADGKDWINPGQSCIVGPRGQLLAGPVEKQETVLLAELDESLVAGAKWLLDVAGHYARPDVFDFAVRRGETRW
jgi:nitrilase